MCVCVCLFVCAPTSLTHQYTQDSKRGQYYPLSTLQLGEGKTTKPYSATMMLKRPLETVTCFKVRPLLDGYIHVSVVFMSFLLSLPLPIYSVERKVTMQIQ